MTILKTLIKIIGGLAIGIVAGLLIAGIGLVIFTDTTFTQFIDKLINIDISDFAVGAVVGIAALFISIVVLAIIHEAGHLVAGLLSGYRFVSFRIFNLTFIKVGGKIRIKRFDVAGTGGQCLLAPPDRPLDEIPTTAYNAGGVIANIVVLIIAGAFLLTVDNAIAIESLAIFCIIDAIIIVMNGLPLIPGNDASNILMMRRNPKAKRSIMLQLKANEMIQNGMRPKDMPTEWFVSDGDIDYGNSLEAAIPLIEASRLIDTGDNERAYQLFNSIYDHRDKLMPIYVKETACELVYLSLVTGRKDRAVQLLDDEVMKYISQYRKVMSSKDRILCAVKLFIDNDRPGAADIYNTLENNRHRYLLQGEVDSDLALMKEMLSAADQRPM